MAKILVLGSNGMLGSDLVGALRSRSHQVTPFDKKSLDITNKSQVLDALLSDPAIVINCAAYTDVDMAETAKKECYAVNVIGVRNIVNACGKINVPLIQISTDYVFRGTRQGYYEDDTPSPINYYGETKYLGEQIVRETLEKYHIVRTSWSFGKNGDNFVEKIVRASGNRKSIEVVSDQFGCPTYTQDLSLGIVNLIEQSKPSGIYHMTNSNPCSRFEFAVEIVRLSGNSCEVIPIPGSKLNTAAKRPDNSILYNSKSYPMRGWKSALKEYMGSRK